MICAPLESAQLIRIRMGKLHGLVVIVTLLLLGSCDMPVEPGVDRPTLDSVLKEHFVRSNFEFERNRFFNPVYDSVQQDGAALYRQLSDCKDDEGCLIGVFTNSDAYTANILVEACEYLFLGKPQDKQTIVVYMDPHAEKDLEARLDGCLVIERRTLQL